MNSGKNSFEKIVKRTLKIIVIMAAILVVMCVCGRAVLNNDVLAGRYIIVMIIYTVAFLLITIFSAFYIYSYCKKLVRSDTEFLAKTISEYPGDETLAWSESSRQVLRHFELMTERKKVLEMSIESSRYIALQQQINPHFLYNALDAIRSDMLLEGNTRIADTVEALSKYFSYSISNLDHLATISEELGNVRDYFNIQKYRFDDRLKLEVINEIGENKIRETYIPRLTIQPIVENSIVHGLENSNHTGTVIIQIQYFGTDIQIKVADDGQGMEPAELEKINMKLHGDQQNTSKEDKKVIKGGIAMYNVNSRIKVLFGEKYGIRVYSVKNVGTQVIILLPNVLEDYMDERL
jgi:two-component system sensor histidine kinase YesM